MDEARAPAGADTVATADRAAAVDRLQALVGSGELTLDSFTPALDAVLAAQSYAQLEAAVAALPPIVRLTPAGRRLQHALEIDAGAARLELAGGWQLAAETRVCVTTGRCRLDLIQASWDATDVDLRLHADMGLIEVIVPVGVAVQLRSASGCVRLQELVEPFPGAPRLRVDAAGGSGEIWIRHRTPPSRWSRTKGWWSRRIGTWWPRRPSG